jgi:pimeloyl-ACP methyl ester carboxylesterase/predicted glycosyltransferase
MSTLDAPAAPREQMRARYPDATGYVERDGVRVFWERYGDGGPTVLLMPSWSVIPSRFWRGQIPYLARYCRVLTFDGRGNGGSDRPAGVEAYANDEFAADAIAVLDFNGAERATVVSLSCGELWATAIAADHPDRVDSLVYVDPAVPLTPPHPERQNIPFDEPLDEYEGWAKYNAHYWLKDYPGFLEFFFDKIFIEPHSTKHIEDAVAWGLGTTPETLADATRGVGFGGPEPFLEQVERIHCPTLVIHGDHDRVRPHAGGAALAAKTGGRLVTMHGSGHNPLSRDPVKTNLLLRDFICPPPPAAHWSRARTRGKRALYVSSPIGLGHVRRDLAIVDELRKLHPDLEIDWLAQHPVTEVLTERGERIHPLSAELASESAHWQSESTEHDLHCFEALRRMDEILVANFMVFHDVARDGQYDLWIGDEAWDVDHFLHENPELKTAAYAWLTDFVGLLPMPDGGEREAALCADYNSEMLEHVERFPRVRDRAVFVGDPDDIVPNRFGEGLPLIREWTEKHYEFCGYIPGFDRTATTDRNAVRAQLGYRPGDQVCLVTVGGSGVGEALLQRVVDAYPLAAQLVPGLRMVVVAGPRIDPATLSAPDGVELHRYVPDLYRHLAASDLAVVQGGLTTTMELTALNRPFIYFPLAHHFEQQFHVDYRLRRYGAGVRLDYEDATPDSVAAAIATEIRRSDVEYRPVAADGAARAAALISELL